MLMSCCWRFCSGFELLLGGVLALRPTLLFLHPGLGPAMVELMTGMVAEIINTIEYKSGLENIQQFIIHNLLRKK